VSFRTVRETRGRRLHTLIFGEGFASCHCDDGATEDMRDFIECRYGDRSSYLLRWIVSEALGHVSVSITLDVYSHVLPSMFRTAADAIKAVSGSFRQIVMG
jgi:hypothetical protein